ncbi:COG2907 Predicted NAD/FAD-binding protein [Oxalobacteraceae bacterium]
MKFAVIGAGWAGCAAAVELTRRGEQVTVIEAARTAGGRARRVEHEGHHLDNGQHILLGAYHDTLRMMQTVGITPSQALLRLPLQMRYPPGTDGMEFIAGRLPAPLHLLSALLTSRGLSVADKLSLARFSSAARWMNWRLDVDCSVAELLERFEQTERLIQLMWRPLCISALNTPPERASAKVFLKTLGDSLGAARSASDMLLPTRDLSALFPDAAMSYVEKRGGKAHLGVHVRALNHQTSQSPQSPQSPQSHQANSWHITGDDFDECFDKVIVATPAYAAQTLLSPLNTALSDALNFTYEPITTFYLKYDSSVQLDSPFFALRDHAESAQWGQFVFDRGQLDTTQAGLLAVVISASTEAVAMGQATLANAVAQQLADVFQRKELATPEWSWVITEKRATFACEPNLRRPPNETALNHLWLAGDYTAGDYPATIEGAVRSGLQAASLALK